jgi:hypothetical protein
MGAAVVTWANIKAAGLRLLARRNQVGPVSARLIALANVLDGMNREAAAGAAGMDRRTLRTWLSMISAVGWAARPVAIRWRLRSAALSVFQVPARRHLG